MNSANTYINQVMDSLSALTVTNDSSFIWFGKTSDPILRKIKKVATKETMNDYLNSSLRNCLYTHFYCKGKATAFESEELSQKLNSRVTPFQISLSDANKGPWLLH